MDDDRANKLYLDIYECLVHIYGRGATTNVFLDKIGEALLGNSYQGTYASDQIPSEINKYAIVNLDNSTEPGSHWVALAQIDGSLMVYDTFGRKTEEILPNIMEMEPIATDPDVDQNVEDQSCGIHCIAWLMLCDSHPNMAKYI
jgi:hypothetical protein